MVTLVCLPEKKRKVNSSARPLTFSRKPGFFGANNLIKIDTLIERKKRQFGENNTNQKSSQ